MKRTGRQTFKKLIRPLFRHKGLLALVTIRGIFFASLGVIFSYALKYMVDGLTAGDRSVFLNNMIFVTVFLLGVGVPSHLFRYSKLKLLSLLQQDLLQEYMAKYLRADNTIMDMLGTGKANNIIQKGVDNWSVMIRDMPLVGLSMVLDLVFGVILVWWQIGRLGGLIAGMVLILSMWIAHLGNKKVVPYRRERRDLYTENDRNIVRCIMSKFEILQNNKVDSEGKKIGTLFGTIIRAWRKESLSMIVSFDSQQFFADAVRVGLGIWIGAGVLDGSYTVGDFVLFRGVMKVMRDAIKSISDYSVTTTQQMIFVEKLWEQFDDVPTIPKLYDGKNLELHNGTLMCDSICFSYPGSGAVFKDFRLSLTGGKRVAFVGESGAGKSTLIKLLSGYLQPQSGKVYVDGQPLEEISLSSYYKHIGYLTQEPNVFDGTVLENLLYGLVENAQDSNPVMLEEHVRNVLSLAKCDFVFDFADGLQTEIGEKGIRLSGGQRQRLAIAKVFLKNPSIVILDEPTSALDSFSEEAISEAMHNLFAGRTVLVIAHRLQTVKSSDDIIVLEKDKDGCAYVAERGTHDELVAKGGYYAKMLEVQTGF